jgi:hypothetical protein
MRRVASTLLLCACLIACARQAVPAGRAAPPEHDVPRTWRYDVLSPFERASLEPFGSDEALSHFLDRVVFAREQMAAPATPTRPKAPRPPEPPPQREPAIRAFTPEWLPRWRNSVGVLSYGPLHDGAPRILHAGGRLFLLYENRVHGFDVDPATMTLRPRAQLQLGPSIPETLPGEPQPWRGIVVFDYLFATERELVVVGNRQDQWAIEVVRIAIGPDGALQRASAHRVLCLPHEMNGYRARLVDGHVLLYFRHRAPIPERGRSHAWPMPALAAEDPNAPSEVLLHGRDVMHPLVQAPEMVLHTLVRCSLADPALRCSARAVPGPDTYAAHVADDAVYVWLAGRHGASPPKAGSFVVRMPLDGSAPTALRLPAAMPGSAPALRKHGGRVHALMDLDGRGQLAVLDVSPDAFTRGAPPPKTAHRLVPQRTTHPPLDPEQARLVGGYLVWGEEGVSAGYYLRYGPSAPEIMLLALDGGAASPVSLGHSVAHARALGDHVALTGTDGWNLYVSMIGAQNGAPRLAARYVLRDAVPKVDAYGSVLPLHASDATQWIGLHIRPTPAATDPPSETLLPLRWTAQSASLEALEPWTVPMASDSRLQPAANDVIGLGAEHVVVRMQGQLLVARASRELTITQRVELAP